MGDKGDKGEKGDAGVGVASASINNERHLILTLTDGSTIDAGYIGGEASTGFAVTFVDYDNSLLKTEVVSAGGNATPPANPSREGYDFAGWDGTFTNVTQNMVITATYTAKQPTTVYYTVRFVDYDGTELKSESVASGSNATPPANPTRSGYAFTGWSGNYTGISSDTTITATYEVDTTPAIYANNVSAHLGDTGIEVVIAIRNNPGIAGATLKIGYDNSALTFTKATYGSPFGSGGEEPNTAANPVPITWTDVNEVTSDTTFVTLEFKTAAGAVQGNTYPISVSYDAGDIFDIDENDVAFTTVNGSITID